jgi:hypothetical protein
MITSMSPTPVMAADAIGRETVISEPTNNLLAGDRLITGRITDIRGEQLEVDIGNPEPLYLPLKPGREKGESFKIGESIVVTMNNLNAVVSYHHSEKDSHHQVFQGRLTTPLTVGLDKAVIETVRWAYEPL